MHVCESVAMNVILGKYVLAKCLSANRIVDPLAYKVNFKVNDIRSIDAIKMKN